MLRSVSAFLVNPNAKFRERERGHHIMIRGIERRKIFINDRDREDFLDWRGQVPRRWMRDAKTRFVRSKSNPRIRMGAALPAAEDPDANLQMSLIPNCPSKPYPLLWYGFSLLLSER